MVLDGYGYRGYGGYGQRELTSIVRLLMKIELVGLSFLFRAFYTLFLSHIM